MDFRCLAIARRQGRTFFRVIDRGGAWIDNRGKISRSIGARMEKKSWTVVKHFGHLAVFDSGSEKSALIDRLIPRHAKSLCRSGTVCSSTSVRCRCSSGQARHQTVASFLLKRYNGCDVFQLGVYADPMDDRKEYG